MNKRGITVVEIIISIGLISVVMLFLFNLLIDMQYEETHASFAKENQINRISIIKAVQDDFLEYNLMSISVPTSTANKKVFAFKFQNISEERTLEVTSTSISYQGETWPIEARNDETKFDLVNARIENSPNTCSTVHEFDINGNIVDRLVCSSYKYFRVIIPVITGDRANIIDDIEFFYLGRS